MTDRRAWVFGEQHLAPDAVVALVDGELSVGAQDRASAHLARCPFCAAEVTAQRQASRAVRGANIPGASSGLLASLMAIPQEVELPTGPDGLAVTADGQLVAVLKPEQAGRSGLLSEHSLGRPGLGGTTLLENGDPLGGGSASLGTRRSGARRGAGIVVSGLVLGALALSFPGAPLEPRAPHPVPNPGIGSASLRSGRLNVAPASDSVPVVSTATAPGAGPANITTPTAAPRGVAVERPVAPASTSMTVSALPTPTH